MPDPTLLQRIRAAARRRQRAQNALTLADTQLRDLIREAFNTGHSGPTIAEHANISTPRAYQIRDGRR